MKSSSKKNCIGFVLLLMGVAGLSGMAEETSRGFKYNNLTVSPFVNLEYAYDSNVNCSEHALGDSILRVEPGVDLVYKGNNWGLAANGYVSEDKYLDHDTLDAFRYGENIDFYKETANGWRLELGQSYVKNNQQDSINDGGSGVWRDRDELGVNAALSKQLSEKSKLTLAGSYDEISFDNKSGSKNYTSDLYGWKKEDASLEYAYKITEKSNVLLNGNYQHYRSDGSTGGMSPDSDVYSLMTGFGSTARRRFTYKALVGATIDYTDDDQVMGWTYSLDSSWVINKKLAATIAGGSYFQPSQSQQNQVLQVYSLSTGLTYRPMRKLTTRLDLAARREEGQYDNAYGQGEIQDLYSARVRADYELMRYVSLYVALEGQTRVADSSSSEYDRVCGSLGLNLRY